MFKKVILTLGIILLSGACVANAAPVGNIAAPAIYKNLFLTNDDEDAIGYVAGFDANMVSDRKIKDSTGDTELNVYAAKLGLIFRDGDICEGKCKVLLYGLLGTAEGEADYGNILGSQVKYETESAFMWGVGATAIVYETQIEGYGDGILRLGGDIKYRYSNPGLDKIVIDGVSYEAGDIAVTDASISYGELQGAIGVSYQVKSFVPYLGVKFSKLDGEEEATVLGTKYEEDFEADKAVGMFVGADILLGDSLSFRVEGSLIDEEAITVGGTVRF